MCLLLIRIQRSVTVGSSPFIVLSLRPIHTSTFEIRPGLHADIAAYVSRPDVDATSLAFVKNKALKINKKSIQANPLLAADVKKAEHKRRESKDTRRPAFTDVH